jgi:chitinase
MNAGDEALYKRFTGLKSLYPDLETWISIGGWSMNDPDQPTATTFSDLAGSADAQAKFFASLISFMETYGFDGVDIDWLVVHSDDCGMFPLIRFNREYPVAEERSGKPADYKNYPAFLRNLRNALSSTGHKYGLSITVGVFFLFFTTWQGYISDSWLNTISMMCRFPPPTGTYSISTSLRSKKPLTGST